MRLAGFDLNLLVVLDALLQESSVTGAARRVGLSQSATSHALARLRDLIGDPILLRTPQGMAPTARARALAGPVRQILESVEGVFVAPGQFDPATTRHAFRIATDPAGQLTILPGLVERLRVEAPDVSIVAPSVPTDRMVRDLQTGAIDLAVTSFLPSGESGIRSEFLISTDYVSIVRRDHPEVGRRLTLKRFLAMGHIVMTRPGLADPSLDAELTRRGLRRKIVLSVESPGPIPALVARTDLVATIPTLMLDRIAVPPEVSRYKPPIALEPLSAFLITHERIAGSAPHEWICRVVREMFTAIREARGDAPARGAETTQAG